MDHIFHLLKMVVVKRQSCLSISLGCSSGWMLFSTRQAIEYTESAVEPREIYSATTSIKAMVMDETLQCAISIHQITSRLKATSMSLQISSPITKTLGYKDIPNICTAVNTNLATRVSKFGRKRLTTSSLGRTNVWSFLYPTF